MPAYSTKRRDRIGQIGRVLARWSSNLKRGGQGNLASRLRFGGLRSSSPSSPDRDASHLPIPASISLPRNTYEDFKAGSGGRRVFRNVGHSRHADKYAFQRTRRRPPESGTLTNATADRFFNADSKGASATLRAYRSVARRTGCPGFSRRY